MSFILYLNENSTVKQILTEEQFVKLAKENCSKAIDGLSKGNMIFRGAYYEGKFNHINNIKSSRKSANTQNYYTVIFDEIFKKQNLPLRSKSTICTTERIYAESFGEPFVLLPFDNCKFGVVNEQDMWHIQTNVYGKRLTVEHLNIIYYKLGLDDKSFDSFCNSIYELISDSPDSSKEDFNEFISNKVHGNINQFNILWYIAKGYGKEISDIEKFFFDIYDPEELEFTFPKNIYEEFPTRESEIWFEGEFLAIDYRTLYKARELLGVHT